MDYGTALFSYTALLKLCDALTVLGVWYGAWYLRFHTNLIPVTKGVPEVSHYTSAPWILVAVYLGVFHIVGAYNRDRIHFGMRALRKISQGTVLGIFAFISVSYFLKNTYYSRILLLFVPALIFPAIVLERVVLHAAWRFFQDHGVRRLRTLFVGHGDLLLLFFHQIERRQPYPVEWLGRIGEPDPKLDDQIPFLGHDSHLDDKVDGLLPHQVVVALPSHESARMEDILLRLSNHPVEVKVLPDFGRFNTFNYVAADECGVPVLMFNQMNVGSTARVLKRGMDVAASGLGLLLLSPFLALVALSVRLSSPGPILYRQRRIGSNGHEFFCLKFRTMILNAEKATGPVWATADDTRTTQLGKFLRRHNLDELPQLYNIFRGDMSLVGPRPERPHFVDQFRKEVPKYMLRHTMKSGLTGWAQVNGWRGNTSIEERIKYDLYYIGHWSLFFDIKIILLTLLKGFVDKNAY
ncbi:MAG: undecaprenyl-phosphate glucose phosphotransferase [Deltaproteobacteria bacterium]|nr:undecaprenyl-phosphate glucose phosphotransferase [Deltaproteobacteria bacterium]MBI3293671.1 undecaprenyl-phosphate glucose phosphotransferase [Deltaproteobacteria bacterium]